jgi:hypothetical protein
MRLQLAGRDEPCVRPCRGLIDQALLESDESDPYQKTGCVIAALGTKYPFTTLCLRYPKNFLYSCFRSGKRKKDTRDESPSGLRDDPAPG